MNTKTKLKNMKKKEKITIYTNDKCGYCNQVKEELTKKNVEFENRLTLDFTEEYQKIVNLTGMPTVPTINLGEEYFVAGRDFQNAQQLVNILKTFEGSPYSESRKAFERVKTLNYNINMAFSSLDKLLKQIENKIK